MKIENSDYSVSVTEKKLREKLIKYIEATYNIGDANAVALRRQLLEQPRIISQQPYLESTKRYRTDKRFEQLSIDADYVKLLQELATSTPDSPQRVFNPPYSHQAQALETVLKQGKSVVVMTGTGSGKTESFLLPLLGRLVREANDSETWSLTAMRSMILYPMNALVNDQVGRLRLLVADERVHKYFSSKGRPARFGRYTSRTPYAGKRTSKKDSQKLKLFGSFYSSLLKTIETNETSNPAYQHADRVISELKSRGKWPAKSDFQRWFGKHQQRWESRANLLPEDAELLTRDEMQKDPPDILVTNYSMLEYMLLRPIEQNIFDKSAALFSVSNEKFILVIDEAHLYRGAAGTEVALMLRRFRARLGVPIEKFQVIVTSASFSNVESAKRFASDLSGVPESEFEVITGQVQNYSPAAVGHAKDAQVLAEINTNSLFDGTNSNNREVLKADLLRLNGGASFDLHDSIEEIIYKGLVDFPPLGILINETMNAAYTVSELSAKVFPSVEESLANSATENLIILASLARMSGHDRSLFSARMHILFRGLPGLWACVSEKCPGTNDDSVIRRLFHQPRTQCEFCTSRVYELYTCRDCGSSYLKGYVTNFENPDLVWGKPGRFTSARRTFAIDMLLDNPSDEQGAPSVDLRYLDLDTGKLAFSETANSRLVFIKSLDSNSTNDDDVNADEDIDVDADAPDEVVAPDDRRAFIPCGVCNSPKAYGKTSIQNHQTSGDEPFLALAREQILIQPPNLKLVNVKQFAPLLGRKVLAFSDSRQVAAKLSQKLSNAELNDLVRPLLFSGLKWLTELNLGLKPTPMSAICGLLIECEVRDSRLPINLGKGESLLPPGIANNKTKSLLDHLAPLDMTSFVELMSHSYPRDLYLAMNSVLTNRWYGMYAMGIGALRPNDVSFLDELIQNHPLGDVELHTRVVSVWLNLVAQKTSILWPGIHDEFIGKDGLQGTKSVNPTKQLTRILENNAQLKVFKKYWLPALKDNLLISRASKFFLDANRVEIALDLTWIQCQSCRLIEANRNVPARCFACGSSRLEIVDTMSNEVFRSRRAYYRESTEKALSNPSFSPLSINAREHSAQINARSDNDEVFSRSEQYELLFQDVDLEVDDKSNDTAIDFLSCTTTMEVGIDIGSLIGVALRNMPPNRAAYQQRAGRAGRRGSSLATVISYASTESHDRYYYDNPEELIRGDAKDPILNLDNVAIAKRHITVYLLQRYHRDGRITGEMASDMLASLGDTQNFYKGIELPNSKIYGLDDFELWCSDNGTALMREVQDWLPEQLDKMDRKSLISEMVTWVPASIRAAVLRSGEIAEDSSSGVVTLTKDAEDRENEIDGPEEDIQEIADLNRRRLKKSVLLMEALLDAGAIPKNAFPIDVATFTIFDEELSTKYRHVASYAPQQSMSLALTQYAPGRSVTVDNKTWKSEAIYTPFQSERLKAWTDESKIFYECSRCGHVVMKDFDSHFKNDKQNCEVCEGVETLGATTNGAKRWIRPNGFAHPIDLHEKSSSNETSRASRAQLNNHSYPSDKWTPIYKGIQTYAQRDNLIVTNKGPGNKGFDYCVSCGRIRPSETHETLQSKHRVPFPTDMQKRDCSTSKISQGVLLGTTFESDVLLVRLGAITPVVIAPGEPATEAAVRTLTEALTIAGTQLLELDSNEISGNFRAAYSVNQDLSNQIEIFLFDTTPGGAGYTVALQTLGNALFNQALTILQNCHSNCDSACYDCLMSYTNRFDHGYLDRHLGSDLLQHCMSGFIPKISATDLKSSVASLISAMKDADDELEFFQEVSCFVGGNQIIAPLKLVSRGRNFIIDFSHPLTPGVHNSDSIQNIIDEVIFDDSTVIISPIDVLKLREDLPSVVTEIMEKTS